MKTFKQITTTISMILVLLNITSINAQDSKKEVNFEESVAIILQDRLFVNSKESARTVKLINFNKKFKLPTKITINDIVLSDNGKGFDKIANDGIYTSNDSYPNIKKGLKKSILIFDNFKYENSEKYNKMLSSNKVASSGFIKCTIKYIFGVPSFHCEISIEW